MVYSVQNESNITAFQSAVAGGVAGAITRAIAQPFDVLKIRFQLQLEPITCERESKYRSILQAVGSIVREEGLTTLWSGHVPAQILSVSFGVLQFSTYEKLTQVCQRINPQFYLTHKHSLNFFNGGIAATLSTVLSYPFDTIRTRLIAEQKTHKAYKGFVDATRTIIKLEGPSALFKGLVPTLGQIAPYAGIQFAVYKLFTENILNKIQFFQRKLDGVTKSSLIANLIAGSVAGFFAKTAIYPFDVVKKRLQIQGFQQYRKNFGRQMYCHGALHCVQLTLKEEGFLALYKGYTPSMLKAVLVSALHFALYDELKYLLLRIQ